MHSQQRGSKLLRVPTVSTFAVAELCPQLLPVENRSHWVRLESQAHELVHCFRDRGTQHPFRTGTIRAWTDRLPSICGRIFWLAKRSERKQDIVMLFKWNLGSCQRPRSIKLSHSPPATPQGLSNAKTCVEFSRNWFFAGSGAEENNISRTACWICVLFALF